MDMLSLAYDIKNHRNISHHHNPNPMRKKRWLKAKHLRLSIAIYVLMLLITLQSCVSLEEVNYLNHADSAYTNAQIKPYEHILRAGDLLFIKVASGDMQVDRIFNAGNSNTSSSEIAKGAYLSAYEINKSGYIQLPLIDSLPVAGLTLSKTQEKLTIEYSKFLVNPHIQVKLGEFPLTVLGEVTNPGVHLISQPTVTLYELLAHAGDITDYGNKEKVTIIREENGKRSVHRVDLTQDDLLTSEYYYLQPNDVVYVPGTKRVAIRLTGTDYVMLISTLSSTLTVILLLINLL